MPRWPSRDVEEYHIVFDARDRLPEDAGVPETRYWDRRLLVLNKYGGKCACCGERHPKFLSIEAIDPVTVHGKPARNLTDWLAAHGFPEGFRVLCHNCNMAMRDGCPCPHNPKVVPAGSARRTGARRKAKTAQVGDPLAALIPALMIEEEPAPVLGIEPVVEALPPSELPQEERYEARAQFLDTMFVKSYTRLGLDGPQILQDRLDAIHKVIKPKLKKEQ